MAKARSLPAGLSCAAEVLARPRILVPDGDDDLAAVRELCWEYRDFLLGHDYATRCRMRLLPDPREFVETALGPDVPEAVRFAAKAAETRAEGVGLVLASPAFQRM